MDITLYKCCNFSLTKTKTKQFGGTFDRALSHKNSICLLDFILFRKRKVYSMHLLSVQVSMTSLLEHSVAQQIKSRLLLSHIQLHLNIYLTGNVHQCFWAKNCILLAVKHFPPKVLINTRNLYIIWIWWHFPISFLILEVPLISRKVIRGI